MRIVTALLSAFCLGQSGLLYAQTSDIIAEVVEPKSSSVETVEVLPNPYGGDFFNRSRMSGDWLGERSLLRDRGVKFDLFSTQFYQGVNSGGTSHDYLYGGKLDYLLSIDGEKLGLWKGLFVKMHAETRYGQNVNGVDGLLAPSNIVMSFPDPERNATAITGLKVTQMLTEHVAIYAAKLNTLDEYPLKFSPGIGSNLPGLAGFQSTALVFNPIVARTVPYSAASVGLAYRVDDEPVFSFSVMDPEERGIKGMENLFARGVTLIPDFILKGEPFGLPAILNVGGTYSNSRYRSLSPTSYLQLEGIERLLPSPEEGGPVVNKSWSIYANGFQALWVNPEDAKAMWGVFGGVGLSDGNPNPVRYVVSGGVGGRSMIRSRSLDDFGIGCYYLGLSDQFKAIASVVSPQRDEYGMELFYNFAVTPWCRLTPSVQIARPSTVGTDKTFMSGIRLQLIF